MSGAYNRKKGHDFERAIAKQFRERLGFKEAKTKREARGGDWSQSDYGEDLVNTGPFIVQCKNTKAYVACTCLESVKEKIGGYFPLVITKALRKRPIAILYWDDLEDIIKQIPR